MNNESKTIELSDEELCKVAGGAPPPLAGIVLQEILEYDCPVCTGVNKSCPVWQLDKSKCKYA